MNCNKKQITEIFSVTSRTVEDWESKGMPVRNKPGRGKSNEYDTAECIDWRLRYMVNGGRHTTAKERREEAEAQLKEMEVAEKTSLFVLAEDVEMMMINAVTAARVVLVGSARKIKKRLDAEYKIDTQLKFIKKQIDETLTRLAEGINWDNVSFESKEGEIGFRMDDKHYQIVEVDNQKPKS